MEKKPMIAMTWDKLVDELHGLESTRDNPQCFAEKWTFKVTNHEDGVTLQTDQLVVDIPDHEYRYLIQDLPGKYTRHKWADVAEFKRSLIAKLRFLKKDAYIADLFTVMDFSEVDPRYMTVADLRRANGGAAPSPVSEQLRADSLLEDRAFQIVVNLAAEAVVGNISRKGLFEHAFQLAEEFEQFSENHSSTVDS